MPAPTMQQQQKLNQREQERLINARFYNKQKWRYHHVDKPWENEDDPESLPGLSTHTSRARLSKPGVYTREYPASKYDFCLLEDGSVVPIPGLRSPARTEIETVKSVLGWSSYLLAIGALSPTIVGPVLMNRPLYMKTVSDWDDKYGQTLDFLRFDQGIKTVRVEWPDAKYVTQVYLDKMMALIAEKKLIVEFGSNVNKFLEEHPVLRYKYTAWQQQQRVNQEAFFQNPTYQEEIRQLNRGPG